MRTAAFTLEYNVELPSFLEDADEDEIVEYVRGGWMELLDEQNFDCMFVDVTAID